MKPVAAIQNPCHESWERMHPEEKGRHCDQCCKVVVDFTAMTNDEISDYLQQRRQEKVCGRFRVEQVAKFPAKRIRFSFNMQRFAAAVLLAFGSFLFASCSSIKPNEPEIMGDIAYVPDTPVTKQKPEPQFLMGDTTAPETPEQHMLGEVSVCPDPDGKE